MHRSGVFSARRALNCLAVIAVVATAGCERQEQRTMADPLASWNEGAAKQSIVGFVKEVTDKTNPDYVPVPDRIAVFDNDGTLWSERPVYFQFYFVIDRVKALAPQHPEWKREQPFKAALDNDMDALVASGKKGLMQLLLSTHAGMTTTEFEQIVTEWIINAKHPTTGKLYKEMVYQPMLELLDYLRTNGFKTYIISGGGIEFLRPWAEEAYGIPPEQVVGSSIKTKFELRDGKPVIVRLPEIDFIDDKAGKPVGIHKFIGKRPIASCGNSDGDLQMMQWTAGGDGSRLMLYVHHTDAEREWAYDRDSHVGRFDKGLDEAREKGWTIVDMKKDWRVIFPFQLH